MNRKRYQMLWFVEIVMVSLAFVMYAMPIQDYALREYKEWLQRPSPETMKAFQDRKLEESRLHLKLSAPFAAIAILLILPVVRFRSKAKRET